MGSEENHGHHNSDLSVIRVEPLLHNVTDGQRDGSSPTWEKYLSALGQSPEAIALMEVNPLQHRFKNFIELYRGEKLVQTFEVVAFDSSVCTPKSWYKSLIRTIRTEYQ